MDFGNFDHRVPAVNLDFRVLRLGEIIFTELLLPIRKKTPGVNKTSALPFSVTNDWPACNSTVPIDFELRAWSPIEAWPST
jgi:hypothetical protein